MDTINTNNSTVKQFKEKFFDYLVDDPERAFSVYDIIKKLKEENTIQLTRNIKEKICNAFNAITDTYENIHSIFRYKKGHSPIKYLLFSTKTRNDIVCSINTNNTLIEDDEISEFSNKDILQYLSDVVNNPKKYSDFDVNSFINKKDTVLTFVCKYGENALLKKLLKTFVNIDIYKNNKDNQTSLDLCEEINSKMLKTLLEFQHKLQMYAKKSEINDLEIENKNLFELIKVKNFITWFVLVPVNLAMGYYIYASECNFPY